MATPRAANRIYCVTCTAICPHPAPAEREAWKAEHVRERHSDPLVKGVHFAPVPSGWGG